MGDLIWQYRLQRISWSGNPAVGNKVARLYVYESTTAPRTLEGGSTSYVIESHPADETRKLSSAAPQTWNGC